MRLTGFAGLDGAGRAWRTDRASSREARDECDLVLNASTLEVEEIATATLRQRMRGDGPGQRSEGRYGPAD